MDHLQQAIQYQAAKQRTIDALDVYSTDGRLILYNLKVLRDDRDFFPPYEAAALVRGETLKKHPEVGAVLGLLAGALDEDAMRALQPAPPGEARERGRRGPGRAARDRPGSSRKGTLRNRYPGSPASSPISGERAGLSAG